jgi:hypothetical protein
MNRLWRSVACLAVLVPAVELGSVEIGLFNPYVTTGARLSPESLVPTVRKWYLPQTLYTLYGWKGYDYTNYARDLYRSYVEIELEGDRFYDIYGNYITKGWNVFNWNQEYPREYGSAIFKDPRFSSWFNRIIVSTSSKGQYHTALTVGEGIRTTLTPLVFSKPLFDGLQWDFLSDKYAFTVLASRLDNPAQVALSSEQGPSRETIFTQLLGLHGSVGVGDFCALGGTYLTAFHQNTATSLEDNSMRGVLGGRLNAGNVRKLVVRLSDDSPEDGRGGTLLLRERIFIDGVEHPEIDPLIEGGILRQGLIEASGGNTVTLTYDLENNFRPGVADAITDFKEIGRIELGLVVANDYRVEVASNMQTNATGEPAFLAVARAPGNITDGSNQRYIRFQYGLPTGNELLGANFEVSGVGGFDLKSEFVSNRRSRRFPNQNIRADQARASDHAQAYYVTASRIAYPFFAYGEVYGMDPDYTTSMFIPDGTGQIDYENPVAYRYEFVDDNDDQDRFPDWSRRYTSRFAGSGQFPDREVFPGLDENNDFISDFNQNQNDQPDYAEPFFRYHVDPPEFLFGVDMNNNTVIDRFENDTEADYPYKRDHQGYNLYLGAELMPQSRLMIGGLREELKSGAQRSKSLYALVTLRQEYPRYGLHVELIEYARKVKDNIADDLVQWTQPPMSAGLLQEFSDPLIVQNTFVNTFYLEARFGTRVPIASKLKMETYRQLGSPTPGRRNETFFGLVNKADYRLPIASSLSLWPQWKQLLQVRTPTERSRPRARELSEILICLMNYRISRSMVLQLGNEYEFFENLRKTPKELPPGFQRDFNRWTLGVQFSTTSPYQGYQVTSNLGFRRVRRSSAGETDTSTMAFVSLYAGTESER